MAPDALAGELEAFVRAGGGLVTTHDAVGYRGMPGLLTDVCKGGVSHVRDETWKVSGTHPVTADLATDRALPQSYYDHIELDPGPSGTVVAVSEKSGRPVVIVGASGKGRYVACGLVPGLSADVQEVLPTDAEGRLILNAIRWCASRD
jgi:hypothetical protein